MRTRQISESKLIQNQINSQSNGIKKYGVTQSAQISARGSLVVKPCLKKLNSSIFTKDQALRLDVDNPKLMVSKIQVQQLLQGQKSNEELAKKNNNMSNSIQYSPQQSNNSISSRKSVLKMITRYRSLTNDEQRKTQSEQPIQRNSTISPSMRKKMNSIQASHSQNHSQTVTFQSLTNIEDSDNKSNQQGKYKAKAINALNINKKNKWSVIRSNYKQLFGEKKKEQCFLIKNAFTLLPNRRYLPLDDEKHLTIRTPLSSSTSSSSLDSSISQNQQTQNTNHLKQAPKLNESSKQFLKQFVKNRKDEERIKNSGQKSDQAGQIQQTILNKVINEMNKEKERSQIIKNLENVKFNQRIKKKQTKQDFDTLIHFRSVDNFCKNKNVIVKLNKGFHPPKDTSSIARSQQEEYKNFIIPCQKQNFFGSEARRMLNRGVPQIIQSLQAIKN